MQFKDFLEERGLSARAVAKEWGMAPIVLSRPLNGKRWPSALILVRSYRLSEGRVTLQDWIETCGPLLVEQGIVGATGELNAQTEAGSSGAESGAKGGSKKAGSKGRRRVGRRAELDAQ